MISTILKSGETTHFALDYNERKVDAGGAIVLEVHNIPNDSAFQIRKTLSDYEGNIAVSARARKLAFHMAVSPGRDDSITREDCVRYINALMNGLGYGEQPYVIYRHNDIDREHYHIVSVRAGRNGHIIDSRFERRRLMTLQEEYSKIFGFFPGMSPEAEARKVQPGVIDAKEFDVTLRIRANIEDIVENYDWDNILEVKLLLKERGIEMRRKIRGEKMSTSFRCNGSDGTPVSRLYGAGKIFPELMFEDMIQARREKNGVRRREEPSVQRRAAAAAAFCEARTESLSEFGAALSQAGFAAVFLDSRGVETDDAQKVALVIINDLERRSLFVLHEINRMTAAALRKKPFKRKKMKKRPLSGDDVRLLRETLAQIESSRQTLRKSTFK